MNTFAVINDKTLISGIRSCKNRLVYVAPGITKEVAEAVGERLKDRGSLAVTLIIDLDPEVCRFGYGTLEGLTVLQGVCTANFLELRFQAGLRIGLFIADDEITVYAPTPHLIEAGSNEPEQPNAISIGSNPLAQITHACAANAPIGEISSALPMQAEIGREAATPQCVEKTVANLKETPPKQYDIARVERVFNSKIQYVELEVKGYRLSSKKVVIPNYLLVGDDEELGKRIKNSFTLLKDPSAIKVKIPKLNPQTAKPWFDGNNKPIEREYDEAQLEMERKKIYKDFLICVNGYGWVIMRSRRAEFDRRIDCFKADIAAYGEAVKNKLASAILSSVEDLANSLLPKIKENVPERYRKFSTTPEITVEDLRAILEQDLFVAFGTTDHIFSPEVRVVFKDVTYESINEQTFRSALKDAMRKGGGQRIVDQLFKEYDSAPEIGEPK